MWHMKAMDKEIVKLWLPNFQNCFSISMLKKHRKFCRRGLSHLDVTPTFKNRPNTYALPCRYSEVLYKRAGGLVLNITLKSEHAHLLGTSEVG